MKFTYTTSYTQIWDMSGFETPQLTKNWKIVKIKCRYVGSNFFIHIYQNRGKQLGTTFHTHFRIALFEEIFEKCWFLVQCELIKLHSYTTHTMRKRKQPTRHLCTRLEYCKGCDRSGRSTTGLSLFGFKKVLRPWGGGGG